MAQSTAAAATTAATVAAAPPKPIVGGGTPAIVEDVSSALPYDINDIKNCFDNLIVIDAGANLTNKKYSRDLDSVIQRAKDAGK